MTRSERCPNRGIDKNGITPDIRIPLPLPKKLTDNVDEWSVWIAEDMKK
jgi:C-terminal processing protease CtpA/Prc